jgi:tetratricopeptide (TPR) repeat protein
VTSVQPAPRRLDPDALAELEEQRDFLLRSLDDLERERAAGDLDDLDYQTLRDDYTRRAAEVLRALDEGRAAFAAAPRRRGGRLRTAVVAAVVAVAAVGAGLAVAASSGTRLPGETFTGEIRPTNAQRLQRAALLAQQGEVREALDTYDEVLADDPENLEALAERGLLLVSLGGATDSPALAAAGRGSVERALAVEPEDARALFYLGLALRLEGDAAGAADAFDRALAADPPAALRSSIESFLASTGGGAEAEAPPEPEPEPAPAAP